MRTRSSPMSASARTGRHVSLPRDMESARSRRTPRTGNRGDPGMLSFHPPGASPSRARRFPVSRSVPAGCSAPVLRGRYPPRDVEVRDDLLSTEFRRPGQREQYVVHERSDDATRTFLPSAEREICRIARGSSGFQGMARPPASSVPRAEDRMKFPRSRISSISPWIRWPGQTGIGKTFSTVERDSVPAYVTFAVPGSRWKVPFASDTLSVSRAGRSTGSPVSSGGRARCRAPPATQASHPRRRRRLFP